MHNVTSTKSNTIFQDDNARSYRVPINDDFLHTNNVKRMDGPVMSSNLSCIEHVCDVLGRAVLVRLECNSTLQDHRQFLREE